MTSKRQNLRKRSSVSTTLTRQPWGDCWTGGWGWGGGLAGRQDSSGGGGCCNRKRRKKRMRRMEGRESCWWRRQRLRLNQWTYQNQLHVSCLQLFTFREHVVLSVSAKCCSGEEGGKEWGGGGEAGSGAGGGGGGGRRRLPVERRRVTCTQRGTTDTASVPSLIHRVLMQWYCGLRRWVACYCGNGEETGYEHSKRNYSFWPFAHTPGTYAVVLWRERGGKGATVGTERRRVTNTQRGTTAAFS